MRKKNRFPFAFISTLGITLILVLMAGCNILSADQPFIETKDAVHFSGGGFKQATEQSEKENKPIFLFAHASYCPACKKMKKEVFPDKEVGDIFNEHFINVQIDIESEEGKKIVDQFQVSGTPTLIFLTPDGKIINKTSGFLNKEELIAFTKGWNSN